MPATPTIVVLEGRVDSRPVWAWCTVEPGTPGFGEVTYTDAAGIEFIDLDVPPRLERWLFTVPGRSELVPLGTERR